MPEFYTIIFSRFFLVGGTCTTAPTDPPFLWVVIGPRDYGFPGPALAFDGPAYVASEVLTHPVTVVHIHRQWRQINITSMAGSGTLAAQLPSSESPRNSFRRLK